MAVCVRDNKTNFLSKINLDKLEIMRKYYKNDALLFHNSILQPYFSTF